MTIEGRFKGKVALVTGGASGIGRAAVELLAREGASVVILDRNRDGGEALAESIRATDAQALFVEANVPDRSSVERAFASAIDRFGKIDCAFNNAGAPDASRSMLDSTHENWDRVFSVNLEGIWHCMTVEIRHMLKSGGGAIVNMSSRPELVGVPGDAVYGASKHGVVGLTKSVAIEFASRGIRINAVCPGVIRTAATERRFGAALETRQNTVNPLGRLGRAGEVAQAVAWLCSDAASFIVGIAMPVDGGAVAR
jgi:NAD(P)-dependent dehydrogenase (short-subunit alcohol dehydrogenase family)